MSDIPQRSPAKVSAEYAALEHEAMRVLHEFLSTGDGANTSALAKAKVAQATLASVQSHNRSEVARNALGFEMARMLATNPDQLAEYTRITQPEHAPIQRALTARIAATAPEAAE